MTDDNLIYEIVIGDGEPQSFQSKTPLRVGSIYTFEGHSGPWMIVELTDDGYGKALPAQEASTEYRPVRWTAEAH